MYFQRRGDRFSFIYYDTVLKKNVRLRTLETSQVKTEAEAIRFCKSWEQKYDATKTRIKRKIVWKSRFHDFAQLLQTYEKIRKEDAPNSWAMDVNNLEYYVFPFFLEKKSLSNLNLWKDSFEEFRDHLLVVESIKVKTLQVTLAYATKNSIIKALNTFLLNMHRRKQLDRFEKCRYFPKWKTTRKSDESVILENHKYHIFSKLSETDSRSAIYFWIGLHTGLRLNELLGLSLADFFSGEVQSKSLATILKMHGLTYFGYLALESQPQNPNMPRSANGTVRRKPLKGKKNISYEDGRIIPIFDKETFNYLVGLWNAQHFEFLNKRHGPDPKDYLLFHDLNKNKFSSALRVAQKDLEHSRLFTPHDMRHTYSTWLADISGGNFNLCRMILGHATLDTTLRYVHINAQLHKKIRSLRQIELPMEIAK